MTNTQLVEIKPRELKFTFEVKKQSSCAVRLANITDQYVAFKVKTTSPKKYCVRPNIGVIKPKSTYDFTVLMQAQRAAPSDMLCKDKFLIQTTVVPFGASEEEITPNMFNKDGGKYIEECKLRVILVSPPQSPVLQPANGISKQGAPIETSLQQEKFPSGLENLPSPVLQPANGISKLGAPVETSLQQEKFPSGLENLPPAQTVVKSKDVKLEEETGEPRLGKVLDDIDWIFAKKTEFNTVEAVESMVEDRKDAYFVAEAVAEAEEPSLAKTVEDIKLNSPKKRESITSEVVKLRDLNMEIAKLLLTKEVEELKSKINSLDSQLVEAESIVTKLEEEKRSTIKDIKMLKQELELLRTKVVGKRAQVGFPPLFLCMVALICLTIGYLLRA